MRAIITGVSGEVVVVIADYLIGSLRSPWRERMFGCRPESYGRPSGATNCCARARARCCADACGATEKGAGGAPCQHFGRGLWRGHDRHRRSRRWRCSRQYLPFFRLQGGKGVATALGIRCAVTSGRLGTLVSCSSSCASSASCRWRRSSRNVTVLHRRAVRHGEPAAAGVLAIAGC